MTSIVPPRAERLMRWSLAPWERAAVLGDLEEEARAIAATRGVDAARRWYWQQAIASVWPNVTRRLRGDDRRMALFNRSLGGTVLWAGLAALQLRDAEAGGAWQRPVSVLIISAASTFRAVFGARIGTDKNKPTLRQMVVWAASVAGTLVLFWSRPIWAALVIVVIGTLSGRRRFMGEPALVRVGGTGDPQRELDADVPNVPLGLSSLVLCGQLAHDGLPPRYAPTIRRRFRAEEAVRLFVAVNLGDRPLHASVDLVNEAGVVVRQVVADVERGRLKEIPATWDDIADRDPAEHFGLINADIPLTGLDAGPYTLRLSVSDGLGAATADEFIRVIA